MGFSELERIQIAAKVLSASIKDADPSSQWYESTQFNTFALPGRQVWTEAALLRANPAPGPGPSTAQVLAATTLSSILEDRSAVAVRLTAVLGVNNTFVALDTYNDFSSDRLDNWVQPQFVPLATGYPSTAYTIRLYNGPPGPTNEVLTTDGTTGVGSNKTVGWFMDYASGILLLAEDFATQFLLQTGNVWLADPHILGFRYVGKTASTPGAKDRWIDQPLVGVQNGVNTVFTSAVPWVRTSTIKESFYVNGIRQKEGTLCDYLATESIPGSGFDTITMAYAPLADDVLLIDFVPV